jgi:hypothetical protein
MSAPKSAETRDFSGLRASLLLGCSLADTAAALVVKGSRQIFRDTVTGLCCACMISDTLLVVCKTG